jgi:Tfp pilus assembly protein PilF
MEMGDINHAIDDFNKAIRMDSNFLKARLKRAYAYFKKGYLGEAKKDLEKAESIASHGWLRP